ncbi:MAG: TlpA family protein disulfide reductase [Saprospiraceae bacterium]|nr:TlpA family protein disulfide reductase [Saprospiraceae bacterium]MBP9193901.1 TlpA family protein disulfide reductase [Saprospiraceae bacterium]
MQRFKQLQLIIYFIWGWTAAAQSDVAVPLYEDFASFQKVVLQVETNQVKLINFWATWCKPCVKELPYFQQLHEKYPELPMVLVSLDKKADANGRIARFLAQRNITIPVVVLADGRANDWIDKISPEWSGSIPATLVYNRADKFFFETDFDSMEAIETTIDIQSLIKNKQ